MTTRLLFLSARRGPRRATAVLATGALAVGVLAAGLPAGLPSATGLPATGVTATSALAPRVVGVAGLSRGSHARVPWLKDNVVHTATGGTVTLPWTRTGARRHLLSLLGHTDRGWMVRAFDPSSWAWTLWLARPGQRISLFSSSVSEGETIRFALSGDARRYLVALFDGDRSSTLRVSEVTGGAVASRTVEDAPDVLAFSGDRLVLGDARGPVLDWALRPDTVVDRGVGAVGADIDHDLLFTVDSTGAAGPTRLSAPDRPPWTAGIRDAAVSPGGGRVLSAAVADADVVAVREVTTGGVRVAYDVRHRGDYRPVWEDNHAFVLVGRSARPGDDRRALVRCTVDGTCVRASAWVHGRISLPTG